MPAGAFRGGPSSGQFDNEGRRAAAPRFDSQPVQGVSSIKPGSIPGAWWALSDNGFGRKWNSSDYRLCVYLFEVRPRTQAGPDSRTALQAVIELSDPARHFPWRLTDESTDERFLTGSDADPESLVTMADESFWIGDEFGPWLLHFSVDGELLAPPVELPDHARSVDHPLVLAGADSAKISRSRGFEAMDLAGDGRTLVTILEGVVSGDPPRQLRVQRYDTIDHRLTDLGFDVVTVPWRAFDPGLAQQILAVVQQAGVHVPGHADQLAVDHRGVPDAGEVVVLLDKVDRDAGCSVL